MADITFGAEAEFLSAGAASYVSAAALSATVFVVAYRDGADSSHGKAKVGTVSGADITFGAEAEFLSADGAYYISAAALSPTAFVVAYRDDADSSHGTAKVGTVSGTAIAFGAEAEFLSAGAASYVSAAALSATAFVVAYWDGADSGHGTAKVGTVSGAAITFGAEAEFLSAGAASYVFATALSGSQFVVVYYDSAVGTTTKVGAVSGTAIAFGAETVLFAAGSAGFVSAAALSGSQFVVAYYDGLDSGHGTAKVGTVSGTSIAFGAEAEFLSAGAVGYVSAAALSTTAFVVAYRDDADSSHGTARVGSLAQSFAASPADSVSLADAASKSASSARSDSAALSDAVGFGTSKSDSAALSDSETASVGAPLSDSATLVDAVGMGTSQADSATLSDSESASVGVPESDFLALSDAAVVGILKSDSAALSDAVGFGTSKSDSAALSDSESKASGSAQSDSVALADSVGVGTAKSDSASLADAVGMGTSKSDSVSLADAALESLGSARSDSATLSDAAGLAVGIPESDSAALLDAELALVAAVEADSASVADAVAFMVGIPESDSVSLADAAGAGTSKADDAALSDGDSAAVGSAQVDGVALSDAGASSVRKLADDAVSLADGRSSIAGSQQGDSTALADSESASSGSAQSDSVAIADSEAAVASKALSDTEILIDSEAAAVGAAESDSASLADAEAALVGSAQSDSATLSDSESGAASAPQSDSVSLSDMANPALSPHATTTTVPSMTTTAPPATTTAPPTTTVPPATTTTVPPTTTTTMPPATTSPPATTTTAPPATTTTTHPHPPLTLELSDTAGMSDSNVASVVARLSDAVAASDARRSGAHAAKSDSAAMSDSEVASAGSRQSDGAALSDGESAAVGSVRSDPVSLADAHAFGVAASKFDSVFLASGTVLSGTAILRRMLLHGDSAVAYHIFDGFKESLHELEWSALSGSPAFGAGRVGGSVAAAPPGPLVLGSASAGYGTLHGAERFAAAMWIQNAWELGASVFAGFLGAGGAPANGVRLLAESPDGGSTYPLWVELVNAGVAHRFPVALPDMDPARGPGPGIPHLIVLQLDRRGDRWSLASSVDGGGFAAAEMSAPRLRGPNVDLLSQTEDDEFYFGIALSGSAAVDEMTFWRAGDGLRRAHAAGLMDLWARFRSPMSAWTDRFGEGRHVPPPRSRGRLGTPCMVNRPPAVSAPSELPMSVEAGSRPRENELELLAHDPDGGAVSWSVASPASFGEVSLHSDPRGAGGVVARYAPGACGTEDAFVLRAESRCGLGEDVAVTVSIAAGAPCGS